MHIGVVEGFAGRTGRRSSISTGRSCRLKANMIHNAFTNLALNELDNLLVGNGGKLVCPTHWSLGEGSKVSILSTQEGHDKPVTYPAPFAVSDVIAPNKIDLINLVDFECDFFYEPVRALNLDAPIFELSCRSGQGVESWAGWLLGEVARYIFHDHAPITT